LELTVPEQWALIREYGEKHVSILERWYALRAFSQNLCAAAVLCAVIGLYKWFQHGYYEWGVLAAGLVFMAIVLMKRSFIFHKYLTDDIDAVIRKMKLKEK
jgi:hypothetical protein